MTALRSSRFEADVRETMAWYVTEAGVEVAARFIDAVEVAVRAVEAHPEFASAHYAELFGLQGLRSKATAGFPYVVFFVSRGADLVLVRCLHGHRDIPQALRR